MGDGHGLVVELRTFQAPRHQSMLQPVLVVSLRKIGASVSAPRLFPRQPRHNGDLGQIQQVFDFQHADQVCIVDARCITDRDLMETLFELAYGIQAFRHGIVGTVDSHTFVHQLAQLGTDLIRIFLSTLLK